MTEERYPHFIQGKPLPERNWRFSFEKGSWEDLEATQVGPNTWRLEETPLSSATAVAWHDIIEGEIEANDTVRFVRVVQPSGFVVYQQVLSLKALQDPSLRALGDRLIRAGGWWENMMGGVLMVHVPPSATDLLEAYEAITRAV